MRAVFAGAGLVALMVVVAIMLILWTNDAASTGKAKVQAEKQLVPMTQNPGVMSQGTGPTAPGTRPMKLTYSRQGFLVENINPTDLMFVHYGLQKGDVIIQAADSALRNEDEEMARMFLQQAYSYQRELVVERGTPPQRLRLEFIK